ncbi:MAG: TIGR03560 family F420-dependent LLM class oxidoreductase [Candidatus Dadabacteria bacterium]|nr:TIGR03560 family F420-dependent LLM class oxidoreductase [Candidatus Dadabacteria bacterium]NIS07642.1 TIGR03560 family F420-dependent LLM class oxidoreductase [Candidatus Dadabacteria bacterium]NIV42113.1 TIGR03560 family F420-dependent LLM class oxidoreductase [Candidatus Dadabacteria bacterium]NIX14737.1 TIGR03560 family F420-dependent LLM class oxidoreductase [Candidatus Dadabacteria bacterium]NIY21280.1 TIGR03560 family F420-dependent LLM class oxidoreductase [Candidatus Dadabacteria ba
MPKIDFGVMLRQQKIDFSRIKDTAQLCDDFGYHSVWLYDHILGMGGIEVDIYEAWTLMSSLCSVTKDIKHGTMVLCNSFRPPALLAKMSATLDVISGGRLEFAIGAGWFEPEYKSYGYDFPDTKTRIEQLSESVQIIRQMWTEEKPNFKGKYYSISDAFCNPKPVQSPHPPIQIGGSGEKYLLRVVAEHADEWNCPATAAEQFDTKYRALENHCRDIGRDVNEIALSQQTVCIIADNDKELEDKISFGKKRYGFFGDIESFGIIGKPDRCIQKIKENYEKGIKKYTIFFADIMNHDTLNFFAREVMSEFRD